MKKIYLLLLTLVVWGCTLIEATAQFSPTLRYRLVCQSNRQGCLALGSLHGSSALLYHGTFARTPDDGWWYIAPGEKGYTLCNAATGDYIVRDTERIEEIKKGLALSTTQQGDATEWWVEPYENDFVIKSVEDPTQWFNLRTGTGLMGTYLGSGSMNERFCIYDELGRKVLPETGEVTPPPFEGNFAQSFDSLLINEKQLVYDNEKSRYYYPLPDSVRQGKPFDFQLTYTLKNTVAQHTLVLDDDFEKQGTDRYRLESPTCDQAYTMKLLNAEGKKVSQAEIKFTYLPLVEINLNDCNSYAYSAGSIRVTDGNAIGYDTLYHAHFKYRGNTSLNYDKKSFNIKLKDETGQAMDHSFVGLRSDNRWILDAMMIDKSCMRNRVAMDLWNDFASKPYYSAYEPKARTGTRGKFVEVFWNHRYHGLYCLTERIDRKQLDIKKFVPATQSLTQRDEVHGLLYKAKEWSYEVFMGHHMDNEYLPGNEPCYYENRLGNERWASYELKYPDYKKEAVEWGPLYEAVKFAATSSQTEFDHKVSRYFDFPVLLDYYLFLDVLLATDNHGKNMYYFAYDKETTEGQKLSIAPWDLDAILGINWQSNTYNTVPEWDLDDYLRLYEHGQNTLFIKLRQSKQIDWKGRCAARYAQLRPKYFNPDALVQRCLDYAEIFEQSGADHREEKKWGGFHEDIQGGADYIVDWWRRRIETLDEKYGFDPTISAINEADAEAYLRICGKVNSITVVSGKARSLRVYNLTGQLVRQLKVEEGRNHFEGFAAGIYLVEGQKVIVH